MSPLEKRLHSIAWWIATIYGIACSCAFLIALCGYFLYPTTITEELEFVRYVVSFWLGIPLLIFLLLQRASIGPIKRAPNTFTLVYVIAIGVLTLVIYPIVFVDAYASLFVGVNMPPSICFFLMFGMNYLKTRELDAANNSASNSTACATRTVSMMRTIVSVGCILLYLFVQTVATCYSLQCLLSSLSSARYITLMLLAVSSTEPLYEYIPYLPSLYRGLLIAAFGSIPVLMMLFYGARKRDQKALVSRKVVVILAAIAFLPTLVTFITAMIEADIYSISRHGYRSSIHILLLGLLPLQLKKSSKTRQLQLSTDEQPDDDAHDSQSQQDAEDSDDNGKEADGLQDSQSQQNIKDGST